MRWIWVLESVAHAVRQAQLAEHGGRSGLLDAGMLSSALAHPRNLAEYGKEIGAAALAAGYGFALSRNHPFIDGNKRTAFVVMELFLELNGYSLQAGDAECIATMESLAAGDLTEAQLTAWLGARVVKSARKTRRKT